MRRGALLACLCIMTLACEKKKVANLTPEAMAAVDGICGNYLITSIEWDGGPVDLDGDGIALPFQEECLQSEPYSQFFRNNPNGNVYKGPIQLETILTTVTPITYKEWYPAKQSAPYDKEDIAFYCFVGDLQNDSRPYALARFSVGYSVDGNGNISFGDAFLDGTKSRSSDTAFTSLEYDAGAKTLTLKFRTAFMDQITGSIVYGTETIGYVCVSSKEKAK